MSRLQNRMTEGAKAAIKMILDNEENIDFEESSLACKDIDINISDPAAYRSVDDLVKQLRAPKESFRGPAGFRIPMIWVVKVVGEQHFDKDYATKWRSLKENSKLRTHGIRAGLPPTLYNWLCGHHIPDLYNASYEAVFVPDCELKKESKLWRLA
ncbi:hypothetical protein CC78DRAFT_615077 [Lojkania enalia]|uniref:Uncharacterized protein n=1 Tax=Lojkania enalia TaxID=147567 RepID=A0A9P4N5L0_9PLEO|nr:hypothetical protein CC78DRAFT_615077 [Didymosphaeria enalia]